MSWTGASDENFAFVGRGSSSHNPIMHEQSSVIQAPARTILRIDASARSGESGAVAHGSHTRRLTSRFVARWCAARPGDRVVTRDVGAHPPHFVSERWIRAAFTPEAAREPWMHDVLAESDALIDELIDADVVVIGAPMYNFNVPAQLKAYVDNVVRVGRTFGFDRSREGDPYWPLLAGRGTRLVLLSARGDDGYGERLVHQNHVEPSLRTAFAYIGITDVAAVAIEGDEHGGERLRTSIGRAEVELDALVRQMLAATR